MFPIIRREFTTILRTRRAAAAQIIMALCFGLLIVLRWPQDARADVSGVVAQQIFRLFAYGLFAAICLMTPIFPATSIVMERRTGTLALLLNSPLKVISIYAGKVLAVMGFVGLILVISLPAAAACYAMGGIGFFEQVVSLYGLLILVSVQYIAVGMLVSSYAGSADASVRITYGCVLGLAVLTLVPYFFFQSSSGILGQLVDWIRCISPIPAIMELAGQGDIGSLERWQGMGVFSRFGLLSVLSIVAMSAWTIYQMRYFCLDRSRSQGMVTDEKGIGVRAARRVLFLVDPNRRSSGISNWTNPVMIKEFRSRRFGRSHWMMRLVGICSVLSLFIAFSVTTGAIQWELEEVGGPLVMLQVGLMILFLPSLTAGLISSERESGAWPLLRSTPLTGGKIVRGKLFSALWTMMLLLVSTIPGYLVMIYIQPTLWVQVVHAFVCLLLAGLVALMVSAAVGSGFRRTAAATSAAYIAVLLLFGGTMLVWLARDAPFGFETVERVLTVNPMAAALSLFRVRGFENFNLLPISWYVAVAIIIVMYFVMRLRVTQLTRPE